MVGEVLQAIEALGIYKATISIFVVSMFRSLFFTNIKLQKVHSSSIVPKVCIIAISTSLKYLLEIRVITNELSPNFLHIMAIGFFVIGFSSASGALFTMANFENEAQKSRM